MYNVIQKGGHMKTAIFTALLSVCALGCSTVHGGPPGITLRDMQEYRSGYVPKSRWRTEYRSTVRVTARIPARDGKRMVTGRSTQKSTRR